ncbi:MAG TPA: folylpolyglutamate synthase/dihydrofolate synthase family protein [Clostridiales bacterium]|nr:folylpolyglutamate synthase/dihydrofolate synthase family protein [Clostridiales bacterium]
MTYEEALEYINGANRFGKKLGLQNIRMLLKMMGDPQKELRFVHIAGTNGKGSTSAFIASILAQAGYRTGIYTSPYLQRFTERIAVSGPAVAQLDDSGSGNGARQGDIPETARRTYREEIGKEELAGITSLVRDCADEMAESGEYRPIMFEIVTAVALEYYRRKKCDIVVLETGMGGRFDATNAIDVPDLAVITTISKDHTPRLGNTLQEIAFEKAGIIKAGGDVLVYDQAPEIMQVFEDACRERGARLHRADFSKIRLHDFGPDGQTFSYAGLDGLKIALIGRHQLRNAAIAIEAAMILKNKGWNISEPDIRDGLEAARWPGRMEILSKDPVVLIDGAHNPEGAAVLRKTLDEYFPGKPLTFIVGIAADKDYRTMLEKTLPGCRKVITVTVPSDRALPADVLAEHASRYCNDVMISDTIEGAVKTGIATAKPDGVVCAFGSLYYIGAVRDMFSKQSGGEVFDGCEG